MNKTVIFIAAITAAFLAASCQTATNTYTTNTNQSANTQAEKPDTANSTTTDVDLGSKITPSDVYRMAHAARKEKSVDKLKALLSKDIIEFFTEVGQVDGKTVDQMLKELCEKPQAEKAESRNEKINGDRATIEYLDEDGEWRTMDFVMEGGSWKMTIPKMDEDEKPRSESNK